MIDRTPGSARKAVLATLLFAGGTAAAHAAPVSIKYLFNDSVSVADFANPGLDPSSIIPDELATAGPWSDSDGTLVLDGLNGNGGSRAIAARSWHDGNRFDFSVVVAQDYELAITKISFFEQGSNGQQGLGPTDWEFFINPSQASHPVATGVASRGSLSQRTLETKLPNDLRGTVTFSIFAIGAVDGINASGATVPNTAANASWRIEDFALLGEVTAVPLPAAVWLFGSALVGLTAHRRRAT